MISHGTQIITDLRRGTWRITSMTRGTFDILGKFSSPYSLEATRALMVTFSTTQWETIRQYGIAHPEIVPYVNAKPLGWGDFIIGYQMVEYVRSSASQVINTGLSASLFYLGGIRAKYRHVSYPGGYPVIAGVLRDYYLNFGGLHGNNYQFYTRYETGGTIQLYSASEFGLSNLLGAMTVLDARNKQFTLTINGTVKTWTYNNFMRNVSDQLTIFALGTTFKCSADLFAIEIYSNDNEVISQYIPCYRKDDGVIGLFDVIRRRFDINAGSGTFLKGSDIYYPGQTPAS